MLPQLVALMMDLATPPSMTLAAAETAPSLGQLLIAKQGRHRERPSPGCISAVPSATTSRDNYGDDDIGYAVGALILVGVTTLLAVKLLDKKK